MANTAPTPARRAAGPAHVTPLYQRSSPQTTQTTQRRSTKEGAAITNASLARRFLRFLLADGTERSPTPAKSVSTLPWRVAHQGNVGEKWSGGWTQGCGNYPGFFLLLYPAYLLYVGRQ
jgi:hypothetical protein